ncbi:unnamed protein product [Rangifer tarandus platyrhynchus]|uniref:Uncharacterized protein n=2 Tax=Rangifer tarandus platyrhynchus TaxID=3082113 RepID=A0AC59Z2C7_RANTA|nr:unnamed protein product [Rangifer tarandus platyrhynchus]
MPPPSPSASLSSLLLEGRIHSLATVLFFHLDLRTSLTSAAEPPGLSCLPVALCFRLSEGSAGRPGTLLKDLTVLSCSNPIATLWGEDLSPIYRCRSQQRAHLCLTGLPSHSLSHFKVFPDSASFSLPLLLFPDKTLLLSKGASQVAQW